MDGLILCTGLFILIAIAVSTFVNMTRSRRHQQQLNNAFLLGSGCIVLWIAIVWMVLS